MFFRTDWQMVHYEYMVYALQAGEIETASSLWPRTKGMWVSRNKM